MLKNSNEIYRHREMQKVHYAEKQKLMQQLLYVDIARQTDCITKRCSNNLSETLIIHRILHLV